MGHSHGIEWTDKLVEEKIVECIRTFKLNRMPTNKECIKFMGTASLSCKISKTLGFGGWAKKLNLQIKDSCSKKGWAYEEICVRDIKTILNKEGFLTPVKSPYDIKVGGVRIDVKMSNLFYSKTQKYHCYTFNINDSNCGSDIYVFYCVDHEVVKKIYIIPSKVLSNKKQFSVGVNESKYDNFLDKWDLIEKYNDLLINLN